MQAAFWKSSDEAGKKPMLASEPNDGQGICIDTVSFRAKIAAPVVGVLLMDWGQEPGWF